MVRGRENLTHKCSGTTSNKIGSIFLHQTEKGESHTLSDKQQGSLVLPFENGVGTKNKNMIKLSKDIQHYPLNYNMAMTSEYLPSILNTVADREKNKTLQSGFFIPKFFKRFLYYQVLQQQIYLLRAYASNYLNIYPDIQILTVRGKMQ